MLGGDSGAACDVGMIPRAIDRVFDYAASAKDREWTYSFKVSVLEVYCDELKDLLAFRSAAGGGASKELKVSHDKSGRVIVPGLEVVSVASAREVQELLAQGTSQRSVSATACNARSSRSHTVFQLYIDGVNGKTGDKLTSTCHFIDLAGSERLDASKVASNPQLLTETKHINASLSALVTCMSSIASKSSHIPFRSSLLTHLLQDSLGKNTSTGTIGRTLFFVNVSPETINFHETMCTLRFADKLKAVEMNTNSKRTITKAK